MTEADSPGTHKRIDVIDPPYIEPYQIPDSMMIAVAVSRKYVIGSSSAIVAADPSPGKMPTITTERNADETEQQTHRLKRYGEAVENISECFHAHVPSGQRVQMRVQ